jgi:hypothetical protein
VPSQLWDGTTTSSAQVGEHQLYAPMGVEEFLLRKIAHRSEKYQTASVSFMDASPRLPQRAEGNSPSSLPGELHGNPQSP